MGWCRRRARVGATALLAGLVAALLPAGGSSAAGSPAASPPAAGGAGPGMRALPAATGQAASSTPLRLRLDDIAPGSLPRRGSLRVSGTVTNDDEEPWTQVNLYTFLGDDPIDDPAELEAATLVAEEVPVGDRITQDGTEDRVPRLEPGQSARFSLSVPSRLLRERVGGNDAEPGVYWFGVHALGTGPQGRDGVADARSRTFLPLLPTRVPDPVRTSLVISLRHPVDHVPDGALSDVDGWSDQLGRGGRLRGRLEFGAASGPAPVSWLLDPAVLEAAERLAQGNPPFALTSTGRAGGDRGGADSPPADPAPDPGPDTSAGASDAGPRGDGAGTQPDPAAESSQPRSQRPLPPGADGSPDLPRDPEDPDASRVAQRARTWLDRFSETVGGDEILTLPYGDLDVAGALDHDPDAYLVARRQPTPTQHSIGSGPATALVPTVAPPNGYLSPEALAMLAELDDGSLLLGSDAMLDGPAPSAVQVEGRAVVLASRGAASGGPGPTPRLQTLALRQRVLSEAALRLLAADRADSDPDPLVVVMPERWKPRDAERFFAGLRVPAIELSTLGDNGTRASIRVDPEDLRYPAAERSRELGRPLFAASASLRTAGSTLANLLLRPSGIATSVSGAALSSASYFDRRARLSSRASMAGSRSWVRQRLGAVTIDAPPGVTLSGATGSFSATVANDLDQPVVVQVAGRSDPGISVPVSAPVELAARSRATVQLEARDVSPGVHNVALRLVDEDGRELPASDVVPIRSAQVSNVIWLILAVGVGLLAVAITLRAARRLRTRVRAR